MPKSKKRKKSKIKRELPVEIEFYNKQLKDGLHDREWSVIKANLYNKRRIHCQSYEDMCMIARWLAARFRRKEPMRRRFPKKMMLKHNSFMGNSNEIATNQLNDAYNINNYDTTTNISVESYNMQHIYKELPLTETGIYSEDNCIITALNNIIVTPLNETSAKKELNIYDCSFSISNITYYSSSVLLL